MPMLMRAFEASRLEGELLAQAYDALLPQPRVRALSDRTCPPSDIHREQPTQVVAKGA
jgi:hypothetical protein